MNESRKIQTKLFSKPILLWHLRVFGDTNEASMKINQEQCPCFLNSIVASL